MAWIWLSITHQLGYTKCFANHLSLSKDRQKHELVGRALLEQSSEEWQKIFEAIALKRCDDRTIRFRAPCPCTIFPKNIVHVFSIWFYDIEYLWISPVNITIHSWFSDVFLHHFNPSIWSGSSKEMSGKETELKLDPFERPIPESMWVKWHEKHIIKDRLSKAIAFSCLERWNGFFNGSLRWNTVFNAPYPSSCYVIAWHIIEVTPHGRQAEQHPAAVGRADAALRRGHAPRGEVFARQSDALGGYDCGHVAWGGGRMWKRWGMEKCFFSMGLKHGIYKILSGMWWITGILMRFNGV